MADSFYTDPIRRYLVKGEVCTLQHAGVFTAAAANTQAVAAVSGKRIRIMGWMAQTASGATQATFYFRDASGGAAIWQQYTLPLPTALPLQVPIVDTGYTETSTGNALFINSTAADINLDVFYITYTP